MTQIELELLRSAELGPGTAYVLQSRKRQAPLASNALICLIRQMINKGLLEYDEWAEDPLLMITDHGRSQLKQTLRLAS